MFNINTDFYSIHDLLGFLEITIAIIYLKIITQLNDRIIYKFIAETILEVIDL